ncbi:site-2 protease family protein [Candidatus Collierbacteria bacterium]|nr:site-2 protease family protein [Candidatus Collierbacteria bacterium]
MLTVLIFFILLSVLVLVHELGHFIAAKKLGVVAEEFGLGLPPKIRRLFTWQGTEFTLNWLPLGGFVKMRGENRETENNEQKTMSNEGDGYFYAQKPWKRAVILVAGVFMNLVLGVAAFTVVYTVMGIPEERDVVVIDGVAPGSPAERARLEPNDIVLELKSQNSNLKTIKTEQFIELINQNRGEEVKLVVKRGSEDKEISITPRVESETPAGEGALGVAISNIQFIHYPWWQMPFRASVTGFKEALAWGGNIVGGLGKMLVDLIAHGKVPNDVAGPVGIARITGEVAKRGWIPLFQLAGILSINLAVVNILPIPALDGGRLLFLGIEKLRGKPMDPKKERLIHLAGYAVLLGLIVLITFRDISMAVSGK